MAAPSKVLKGYNAGVVPHAVTSRWSYTVPAGRFAIVELLHHYYERITAAAPAAPAYSQIYYTPSGAAAVSIMFLEFFTNVPDDQDHELWGSEMRMQAGDKLECFTTDTSVGGILYFNSALVATEYGI